MTTAGSLAAARPRSDRLSHMRASLTNYVALTRPRVLSGVLLTAPPALALGRGDWPDGLTISGVMVGVALVGAGCGALNAWWELDRDARMARTKDRPLPTGRLAPERALVFGVATSILGLLAPGPAFYPADRVTDQPETFFVAETIREKLFHATREEVPYASAVRVEELVERGAAGRLLIRAVIFVEQPSQKTIVVGAGGAMVKRIGQAARRELEAFFGVPVYLDLWVQVRKHWRRDAEALRELGYRLTS